MASLISYTAPPTLSNFIVTEDSPKSEQTSWVVNVKLSFKHSYMFVRCALFSHELFITLYSQ